MDVQKSKKRICVYCGKTLSSAQTLWRHKKTCKAKGLQQKTCKDKGLQHVCICGEKFLTHESFYQHQEKCSRAINAQKFTSSNTKLVLEWNGSSWETKDNEPRYHLNLGRDLSTLVENGVIQKDRLDTKQKECIHMYHSLFI